MASKKKDAAGNQRHDDFDARIEELKRKAAAFSDGGMRAHVSPHCPPHIQEQFWEQVIAFESAVEEQPFDVLERSGVSLPPADELDDTQVRIKLWEVIRGLAFVGMYLSFTDHLSDRELYARLWIDILRVPTALEPETGNAAWHVDLTGGGTDEDVAIYLKYYADDDDRRSWADDWPDDPMPAVAQRPFDRDRYLPRPSF